MKSTILHCFVCFSCLVFFLYFCIFTFLPVCSCINLNWMFSILYLINWFEIPLTTVHFLTIQTLVIHFRCIVTVFPKDLSYSSWEVLIVKQKYCCRLNEGCPCRASAKGPTFCQWANSQGPCAGHRRLICRDTLSIAAVFCFYFHFHFQFTSKLTLLIVKQEVSVSQKLSRIWNSQFQHVGVSIVGTPPHSMDRYTHFLSDLCLGKVKQEVAVYL